LGDRQRHPIRDGTKAGNGARLPVDRGPQQLAGLAAQLVKVRTIGQLGHGVSS
jgi:hypothetical protein